ncbi:uncharacterized protein LOC120193955 [Hibiscus syriacus]|uniref:uncharacterized protein LOC120193955 n=1 Tax=Hibiscus syriacus TaxID=106335 RepID=UPI0019231B31|nr:uncharacterized protein LOC120193955 [Hibiscus syriacus]
MSKQSEQENLNKLTQQEDLTSANHRLRSQSPAPYAVMGASSLAPGECSNDNWGFFYSPGYIRQLTLSKLFDEDEDEELFRQGFGSITQTRETNPNWESYSTPRPSPEEGEDGAQSIEPDPTHRDLVEEASDEPRVTPSHLEKEGTPSQACPGRKRRKIIPSKEDERVQKKRDADKKYRADIRREVTEHRRMKPEYDRVMEVASRFGGIDEMESQMNHMNSELRRIQQKEVDRQLFETELNRLGQMKSKYGGIDQMEFKLDKFKQLEAQFNRLESMKSKYGGIEKMESMLDRFMVMEAESRKLNEIKSKLGIHEIGSILQKWKEMGDELRRFNQIKSKFGGIDEIEPKS